MLRNKVEDFIQTRVCRVCLIWNEKLLDCKVAHWGFGFKDQKPALRLGYILSAWRINTIELKNG